MEILSPMLLTESVDVSMVSDAIKNRYRVVINYVGDPEHGIADGIRTIEVYAYGLTKAGNPVIRAYQPYGDTVTTTPNWKFFRLDRITSWKQTYSLIQRPAPKFNPDGDRSMSQVYLIADFSKPTGERNTNGPKQMPKVVGKIDNIDDINKSRELEKRSKTTQSRVISSPLKPLVKKQPEVLAPEINNLPKGSDEIKEPEIKGVENIKKGEETFKPEGEMSQLDKIKDLNKRLDNAKKIDLSSIPKR